MALADCDWKICCEFDCGTDCETRFARLAVSLTVKLALAVTLVWVFLPWVLSPDRWKMIIHIAWQLLLDDLIHITMGKKKSIRVAVGGETTGRENLSLP